MKKKKNSSFTLSAYFGPETILYNAFASKPGLTQLSVSDISRFCQLLKDTIDDDGIFDYKYLTFDMDENSREDFLDNTDIFTEGIRGFWCNGPITQEKLENINSTYPKQIIKFLEMARESFAKTIK